MKQAASGACGFAEIETRDITAMLWDSSQCGPLPALTLGQSTYLPKLGSVHSFVNCVMWCKLLWFLDCGCFGSGDPRPPFSLHDSRSRKFLIQTSSPFWWVLFLALEPKAATHLVLPLVLPSIPQPLLASVSQIPCSSAFWLIWRTPTQAPACLRLLLDSSIPFISQMFL